MVTHDQEEAQTMADRIFVMNEGEIIQSGTPSEIYTKANSPFIASFIGSMNFIPATIDTSKKVLCNTIEINCDIGSFTENDSVQLAVRPEEIYFQQENQDDNVIEDIATRLGVDCFRGDEKDVLTRIYQGEYIGTLIHC